MSVTNDDRKIFNDLDALTRDPAIIALIRSGKTMGCFYIESPAMRALLKRLDCTTFEMVVAASSIIRIGFEAIKNFPASRTETIVEARRDRHFEDLSDFLSRARPTQGEASKLIRVGACDAFEIPRAQLLLDLDLQFSTQTDDEQLDLFGEKNPTAALGCET